MEADGTGATPDDHGPLPAAALDRDAPAAAVAALLDRIDVDLSRVEESLALLDDEEVDPDAAVAWLDR